MIFVTQTRRLLRGGAHRLLGFDWLVAILYERDLVNKPVPGIQPKVPVEIIMGGEKDLDLVKSFLPEKIIRLFEQRLKEDKIWLLGLIEGQVAYTTWISFDDEFEPNTGIWVRPTSSEAYLFNSYTRTQFRGLGLHSAFCSHRMTLAKERGANFALGIVLMGNEPARHIWMTKLGSLERERILTVRLLGSQYIQHFPQRGKAIMT